MHVYSVGEYSQLSACMKRLIPLPLVILLFAVSGCSAFEFFSVNLFPQNTRVTTDSFDGVIFEAENSAQAGLGYEFNDPIVDYWTPTEEQVMALEAALVPFLESEIAPDDYRYGFWDEIASYKRQYFGIAFEAEQPLIYANYFCVDMFDQWLESYVLVMDGGDCFFQTIYDPATGTFSSLRINGEA
jgi:hypothetical protein